MMLGCSSLADVRASRWNRSTNSLSNARENGRTLIATSRSSCFSRALKTMAMPPRPSSSRISYSSFSCSRTRSSSVTSTGWSRTAATGVVCDRSSPQERQNLLASSFWVPQREQYINSPKGRGNLGICRTTCQLATVPRRVRSRKRVRRTLAAAARKGARRGQRWCKEQVHPLRRHAAHAEQRAEGTVGGAGEEPKRHHMMGEAAQPGDANVQRQPGAQLIRPAGAALFLPPAVGRGPRDPLPPRDREGAGHQPPQRDPHPAP